MSFKNPDKLKKKRIKQLTSANVLPNQSRQRNRKGIAATPESLMNDPVDP